MSENRTISIGSGLGWFLLVCAALSCCDRLTNINKNLDRIAVVAEKARP